MRRVVLATAVLLVTHSAIAYDWAAVRANVTRIEASNMGETTLPAVYIRIDQGVACNPTCGCPATSWLYWVPLPFDGDVQRRLANVRAFLSQVQIALAAGKQVELYGYNPVNGMCQISNMHVVQ